jgi:hypothetical protein
MLKLSERKEELLKDLKELEEQIFSHLPHRPNLIPSKLPPIPSPSACAIFAFWIVQLSLPCLTSNNNKNNNNYNNYNNNYY